MIHFSDRGRTCLVSFLRSGVPGETRISMKVCIYGSKMQHRLVFENQWKSFFFFWTYCLLPVFVPFLLLMHSIMFDITLQWACKFKFYYNPNLVDWEKRFFFFHYEDYWAWSSNKYCTSKSILYAVIKAFVTEKYKLLWNYKLKYSCNDFYSRASFIVLILDNRKVSNK